MKKLRPFLIALNFIGIAVVVYLVVNKMNEKPSLVDPEFQKLAEIWNHFKAADVKVTVDGVEFPLETVLQNGQKYLRNRYKKGMTAKTWIEEYVYRSKKGEIMYFKYPDGTSIPMRDVFLEELAKIEGAEAVNKSTSQLQEK